MCCEVVRLRRGKSGLLLLLLLLLLKFVTGGPPLNVVW